MISDVIAQARKCLQSEACLTAIEAVRTQNASSNRISKTICERRSNIACTQIYASRTDTGANIWLHRTVTIEIVKQVRHQFPSLDFAILVEAVNHSLVWKDDVGWNSGIGFIAYIDVTFFVGEGRFETEAIVEPITQSEAAERL